MSVPALLVPDAAVSAGPVRFPIHHPMTHHLTIDAVDPDSDEPNDEQCVAHLAAPSARETSAEPAVRAHADGDIDGRPLGVEPSDTPGDN